MSRSTAGCADSIDVRLLLVDADDRRRAALRDRLAGESLCLDVAVGAADARAIVAETPPDVVWIGDLLDPTERAELCRELKASRDRPVAIVLLGPSQEGADELVRPPADADEVVERLRLRLRVAALQAELRSLGRTRAELLHALGSDFLSPLVGIVGAVENMLGGYAGTTTPEQRECLMMIGRTAEQVHDELERIDRMARLESRPRPARAEPVDLGRLTQRAITELRPRAAQASVAIDVGVEPGTPLVRGDAEELREVVQHVLENAIKFSPSGGTIHVRIDEVVERESFFVRWSVTDEGAGIRPADFERIFERFERAVGPADASTLEGIGVGLAIVREIVDGHGGRIDVRSELGQGSTFTVFLPTIGAK